MVSNAIIRDVKTFLSPSVRDLIVDARESQLTSSRHQFLTPHLTFNWDSISSQLEYSSDSGDFDQEKYSALCQKLWPVIIECGRKLQECKGPPVQFFQWTSCESDILLSFIQLQNRTEDCITPLKSALLLSSIFEHSVGNVYQLKEKNVPFLLRDLLNSHELNTIFGNLPMLVAKALLGTPLAFNIRNICWHGFPTPEEIHGDIAATLLVLITSFGEILQTNNIISFPYRSKMGVATWTPLLPSLQSLHFPQLTDHFCEVSEFLAGCYLIPSTHQVYWISALNFMQSKCYAECLMLLLPALEHTLRCAFCSLNGCPDRVLVAEQHVLYTTMDEILDQHFTSSDGLKEENGLPLFLGRRVTEMLMDMFCSFGGPRIRDKLSHGECDLKQIPAVVANHLFCISLLVLLKLGASSELKLATCIKKVEEKYSAQFHSSTLLKNQASAVLQKIETLNVNIEPSEALPYLVHPETLNFQSSLLVYSLKFRNFCNDDFHKVIDCYLNEPVVTLYRTKSDLSVIALLRKIISALDQACVNSLAALETRRNCLSQHALRSRQRKSYLRMLEYIPSFQVMIKSVTFLVLIQLLSLPKLLVDLKFIKNVQQYAENISSLSSMDKNRWAEIKEKTADFCHQCGHSLGLESGL